MATYWPVVSAALYLAFAMTAGWLAATAGEGAGQGKATRILGSAAGFDALYIAAGALFIVAMRLPILALSRDLQPDEAQYGANAMMAASGWLNWDTLDSGSSGPLQSMAQAWPLLFGGDVTFTTIHITGAVAACAMSACVYLILRRALGTAYGVLFSLPTTLFLATVTYWDLVHSTSLYIPITLALFGVLGAVSIWQRPHLPFALAAAFTLGLIPLVKPHGVIMGAYAGAGVLWAYARPGKTWGAKARRALPIAAVAALPLCLSLAPVISRGRWNDFVLEGLSYSEGYVASPIRPWYWLKVALQIPHLFVYLTLLSLAVVIFGAIWRKRWRETRIFTWFSAGLLVAAAVSILAPGQNHHHYLLFLVPTLPLPAAALAKETLERRHDLALWVASRRAGLAAAAIALALAPTAVLSAINSPALRANGADIADGLRFTSPRILRFLVPSPDARLIVFGWSPYLYVEAGMPPGTRETWSENIVEARPNRGLYRLRFLAEMDRSRPAVFVDAVNEGDFGYLDNALYGPRSIPALAWRLDDDYTVVSRLADDPNCAKIYLRKDIARLLGKRLADVSAVTASGFVINSSGIYRPEHVIDRNVFEDCVDRWIAPAAPAWLDLKLAHPQRLARVSLLNTRGTWNPPLKDPPWIYPHFYNNVSVYHAARTAVVKLMSGNNIVAEKQATVDGYPYWTDIDFDAVAASVTEVRIEFPDWRGAGPGLNEVALVPVTTLTRTSSIP